MHRKIMYLASFVLVLTLVGTSAGQTDPTLVGWWMMDEGAGGIAYDSSSYSNHGALGGDSLWVPGCYGGAIQFDGTDDYVDCGDNSILNIGTGDASVCAWIRFSELSPEVSSGNNLGSIAGKGYLGNLVGHGVFVKNGQVSYQARNGKAPNNIQAESDGNLNDGNWHFVTGVLNRDESDGVRLYIDGVLQSLPGDPSVLSGISLDNSHRFIIGSRANANNLQWDYKGDIDEVRFYTRALTKDEIRAVMTGQQGLASNPSPADGLTEVPRDVILSWVPGEFASTHDVYLGTVFNDVNEASRTNPTDVLVSQNQNNITYDPAGPLELGRTYYWRVDEVNDAPDYTIYKGNVWEFTIEPIAYPVADENITAISSSVNRTGEGPENTINGSGLGDNDLHSLESADMWLSNITDPNVAWIQYEFNKIHKLYEMLVWNYNSSVEPVVGFGIKEAIIEYSLDGTNWAVLGTTHEFARGTGLAGYAANTTVDLGGLTAKYIKITAKSNWGGMVNQYGLSEVRFLYIPVWATEPSPASGATDVSVDAALSFKAGREAARHDVYLDTNEQAVIDGTAPVSTVTEPSYAASLDLASTYYWRVDEVNDAETPTTWQGDIWNLSTREYLVVDDFESYNDIPADQEGSILIYGTWADGFENPVNGATIGYNIPFQPTMETSIIYDGKQSAPLYYDNTAATYSEVTAKVADLGISGDWTKHNIKALTLRFFGDPNNFSQQMYVKINGSKVTYDGDLENLMLTGWQMWYIELASTGASLNNVTDLAVGFERIGTLGGKGMILLDGIKLYSYDRQLVTPSEPGVAGLQARYEFEGNTNDSSGNARNGTIMGSPTFVPGKAGQAINLRGLNDYVEITGYKGIIGPNAITVTAWIKTSGTETGAIVGWGPNIAGQRFGFRVDAGRLRIEHQGGNVQGDTSVNDGSWHHVAVTVQANATISYPEVILYVDGKDDTRPTTDPDAFNLTAGEDVRIGSRPANNDRFFIGQIDDVHIYERTLSQEEIALLAGRTKPFDRPF